VLVSVDWLMAASPCHFFWAGREGELRAEIGLEIASRIGGRE
jgi:hypothetical protein